VGGKFQLRPSVISRAMETLPFSRYKRILCDKQLTCATETPSTARPISSKFADPRVPRRTSLGAAC